MSNHPHMRPNGNTPQQVPVQVPPGPVPVQVIVEQVVGPGDPLVALHFLSPTGHAVFFLPVDGARQVAQMIQDKATPITLA